MFGALAVLPFIGFDLLMGIDWLWAIISGVAFGLALWTFYLALHYGEITHIGPFNGAMVNNFSLCFGLAVFREKLSGLQMGGIVILIFASLLLSFEKAASITVFILVLWAILSGLLFAVSHVARNMYGTYPFGQY